ncbi:hypothetical protein GCM10023200_39280 [Actinomycetospora chlora]|uniref:Uncharacterized protein n=1 Tax=Actinomycetospora chlora TaxID=663608 RepID=A0ABP9BQI5_9PSEU
MSKSLIPLLSDLCFRNPHGITRSFPLKLVQLHGGSWDDAQNHWELLMQEVLNSDAVEENATGVDKLFVQPSW